MTFAPVVIDQHFMLQNEVVERMVAEPGTKAFSRLSVMLQYRYVMDKMLDAAGVVPAAAEGRFGDRAHDSVRACTNCRTSIRCCSANS
jgi:hypothetical protein